MLCCQSSTTRASSKQDSPLQIKLIKLLGLNTWLLQNLVFRRKPSKYKIEKDNKRNKIYTPRQYQPPNQYIYATHIIENGDNSVPVVKLTPKKGSKYTVIYAHGNSSDLRESLLFIEKMTKKLELEYIAFDYSGYGQSKANKVGQEIIIRDLQLVIGWANKSPKQIILWGFSLGTYPTLINSIKYNVHALILQCPIASINCLFASKLYIDIAFEQDYFANINYISKVRSKVFMIHSIDDQVIPINHAKLLFHKFTKYNGFQNISFFKVSSIKHNSMHKYIFSQKPNWVQSEFLAFLHNAIKQQNQPSGKGLSLSKNLKNKKSMVKHHLFTNENKDNTEENADQRQKNINNKLKLLRQSIKEAEIRDYTFDEQEFELIADNQQKTKEKTWKGKLNKCSFCS